MVQEQGCYPIGQICNWRYLMLFKVEINYNKLGNQLLATVSVLFFTFWHAVGKHGVENS